MSAMSKAKRKRRRHPRRLQPGAKVEVEKVWAASPKGPLKAWFKGYKLVSIDGNKAVVKHTSGMYEGINVNYPKDDVRSEK